MSDTIINKMDAVDIEYTSPQCNQQTITSIYTYRDIPVTSRVDIEYINYVDLSQYTRLVRALYTVKCNNFTHNQNMIIFNNVEYLTDIIKKRLSYIFDNDDYSGFKDNFEITYNKNEHTLNFSFDYRIEDKFNVSSKDTFIIETIIGTIIVMAEELKNSIDQSPLKIIESI